MLVEDTCVIKLSLNYSGNSACLLPSSRRIVLFMIVPRHVWVMYCVIYDCATSCLVWSCIALFMIVPHHVWIGHVLCYL